jgi:mRNA interferase HigB
VRVVGIRTLKDFMTKHPLSRASARAWLAEAQDADWKSPGELKERYPGASLLAEGRVVFDIAGGRFRLVCTVAFQTGIVVVERIGTHAEYDKWKL